MNRLLAGAVLWLGLVVGAHAQTVVYYHTDALGTPVAVTDANGNVIERSEYEPYGKLLNRPLTDGPGYTGHVSDAATGLSQMQQRYYDPGIGRFLSVDPVTADGNTGANFNRYWYANNNPYRFTDPDGRQPCSDTDFGCGQQGRNITQDPQGAKRMAPIAVVGVALMAAPLALELGTTVLTNPGAMATATDIAAGATGVTGTAGAGLLASKAAPEIKALAQQLANSRRVV